MTEKRYYVCPVCERWNDPHEDRCWKCKASFTSAEATAVRNQLTTQNYQREQQRRRDAVQQFEHIYKGTVVSAATLAGNLYQIRLSTYDTEFKLQLDEPFRLCQGDSVVLMGEPESESVILSTAVYSLSQQKGAWLQIRTNRHRYMNLLYLGLGILLLAMGQDVAFTFNIGLMLIFTAFFRIITEDSTDLRTIQGKRFVALQSRLAADAEYS